jgi:hypothetical protein
VLYGDSLAGKTTWARSLGKHVRFEKQFSGKVALTEGPSSEYAVFDDIAGGLAFFPGWKGWLGCQPWISVKQMYRDPVNFNWNKPSIWVTNRDPREDIRRSIDKDDGKFFEDDLHWLEANCMFSVAHLWDPLVTFHANNT